MKVREIYLLLAAVLLFLVIYIVTTLSIEESLIIGLQFYFLFRLVNNFGNTICFFDFLCFYSIIDTLLMPVIGYNIYNKNFELSKWGWYMRVPESVYYGFMIPANLVFFAGLYSVGRKFDTAFFKNMVARLSVYSADKGKIGIVLTIIGFVFSFADNYISGLGFIGYLLGMLRYVGPVYVYFSTLPLRNNVLIFSMITFLTEAVVYGMFGEFVMYLILLLIIVTIKYNFRFHSKLTAFLIGIILVFALQSIKSAYRTISWKGKEVEGLSLKNSSKLEVFGTLFYNRLQDVEKIFDKKAFFSIYIRLNQGFLISRTMDYVPRVEPYAEGETIARAFAGILVPRFLWPDKPEAGGAENIARFLGMKKKITYSLNIGPYGEAYGNFGPFFGVLFIYLYGLLLSYLFKVIIHKSIATPSIILWAPVLFFSTLTMETDILSTINSLLKTAVFMYVLFWAFRNFFKVSL